MSSSSDAAVRQRNPRGEGDRLRQDLLDAAVELMGRHGTIDAISLRAVAREAGVSPTAVYRHFDDHLALLREAVVQCWDDFRDDMRRGLESSDDPYEAFRRAGRLYVDFAMHRRGQYRVLFSNRIDLGMDRPEAAMAAFETLVALVTNVLDANDDRREPELVALQVHTWIHGIVDLCANHADAGWPDATTMLEGLAPALRLTRPAS